MQKRSSNNKQKDTRKTDESVPVVEEPNQEAPKKNPHAVELGRLGGLKGGPARSVKMTPERRKEIAKLAASTRWRKRD